MLIISYLKDGQYYSHPTRFTDLPSALGAAHELVRDRVADWTRVVKVTESKKASKAR
jgi:hypothetical protein